MAQATFTYIAWEPTTTSIEEAFTKYAPTIPAATYPAIGSIELAKLHEAMKASSDDTWKNTVLLELITAAQHQDAMAQLTLIRLLIPKAIKVTIRAKSLRLYSLDDALSIYLTALWEAIQTYPLTRTRSVSFNLAMSALNIVNEPVRRANREIKETSMDELTPEFLEGIYSPTTESTAQKDLAEVFAWVLTTQILTRDEVALLTTYYLSDDTDEARQQLSRDLDVSKDGLRKRANRLRDKLTAAVKTEVASNGW